jgi:hypothetical protein
VFADLHQRYQGRTPTDAAMIVPMVQQELASSAALVMSLYKSVIWIASLSRTIVIHAYTTQYRQDGVDQIRRSGYHTKLRI